MYDNLGFGKFTNDRLDSFSPEVHSIACNRNY